MTFKIPCGGSVDRDEKGSKSQSWDTSVFGGRKEEESLAKETKKAEPVR